MIFQKMKTVAYLCLIYLCFLAVVPSDGDSISEAIQVISTRVFEFAEPEENANMESFIDLLVKEGDNAVDLLIDELQRDPTRLAFHQRVVQILKRIKTRKAREALAAIGLGKYNTMTHIDAHAVRAFAQGIDDRRHLLIFLDSKDPAVVEAAVCNLLDSRGRNHAYMNQEILNSLKQIPCQKEFFNAYRQCEYYLRNAPSDPMGLEKIRFILDWLEQVESSNFADQYPASAHKNVPESYWDEANKIAFNVMAFIEDPGTEEILENEYKKATGEIRDTILLSRGMRGDERTRTAIVAYAMDASRGMRRNLAIRALAEVGELDDMDRIMEALRSEIPFGVETLGMDNIEAYLGGNGQNNFKYDWQYLWLGTNFVREMLVKKEMGLIPLPRVSSPVPVAPPVTPVIPYQPLEWAMKPYETEDGYPDPDTFRFYIIGKGQAEADRLIAEVINEKSTFAQAVAQGDPVGGSDDVRQRIESKIELIMDKFPRTEEAAKAMVLLVDLYVQQRDPAGAQAAWERLARSYPRTEFCAKGSLIVGDYFKRRADYDLARQFYLSVHDPEATGKGYIRAFDMEEVTGNPPSTVNQEEENYIRSRTEAIDCLIWDWRFDDARLIYDDLVRRYENQHERIVRDVGRIHQRAYNVLGGANHREVGEEEFFRLDLADNPRSRYDNYMVRMRAYLLDRRYDDVRSYFEELAVRSPERRNALRQAVSKYYTMYHQLRESYDLTEEQLFQPPTKEMRAALQ